MALSLTACGSSGTTVKNQRPNSNAVLQQHMEKPESDTPEEFFHKVTEPTEPKAPVLAPLSTPAEPDRESLEQIADLLGTDADYEDLTDEELTDLIESELHNPEATIPMEPVESPRKSGEESR